MTLYVVRIIHSAVTTRGSWDQKVQTSMAVIFTSNELETAPDVICTYKESKARNRQKAHESIIAATNVEILP
jgi:hypothetical protein